MTTTTAPAMTARDVLRDWYRRHPGVRHRCYEVAEDLWNQGITLNATDRRGLTHKVATFSARLAEMGDLERVQMPVANLAKPVTLYGVPGRKGRKRSRA